MTWFDDRMAELRQQDAEWLAEHGWSQERINARRAAEAAVTDMFPQLSNEQLHEWARRIRDEGKEGLG